MSEDRMLSDEILLGLINKNSGGGGGGTGDYNDLKNLPQIGSVIVQGNKSLSDFGIKNEFIGTTAQWNALTTEQKKAYDTYQITDDFISGSGSGFVQQELYTGTSAVSTYALADNISNYDLIYVYSTNSGKYDCTSIFRSDDVLATIEDSTLKLGVFNDSEYEYFRATADNALASVQRTNRFITKIIGFKFVGSGSGSAGDDTNYLYNGEAEPENFTMPSGTAMQPLFIGNYGMDFKGGAGDFIRVATSKTAIDFTGISKLRFVGLHYESFDVLMGSFIEDVDVTNITGSKYLSVGYKTTMQNNSAVYAITDTATVTSSDTVAIKTKTGATNVSMFTQIIAE